MEAQQDRSWDAMQRNFWWLKTLALAATIAGATLGFGKWLYSRASQDDVAAAIEKIEQKKVDKEIYDKDIQGIDKKIEKQDKFLGTIHENVIRLMEANDVQPKRIKKDD